MKIIELHHPYCPTQLVDEPIVLALGFFDGVHLGHQAVIERAKQEAQARGLKLAVMTFKQHPKLMYLSEMATPIHYLTTNQRKAELFAEFGVDILYLIDFTREFSLQSPQAFVDTYIVGLQAQVVVAGYDYTYGKPDSANMQTLPTHAQHRFAIVEVAQLTHGDHKVGSSNIRTLIASGQIEAANAELGYIYETTGIVVHGEKRGRTIGYPTANVQTTADELLPGRGIYVVAFHVDGNWYQGMASIGYNVTFASKTGLTCEVHVLDFDEMIYGKNVKIRWYHYLRSEIKFDGIEGLIQQLDQDQVNTRAFFAEKGSIC
ncbi:riboflavin biosynthesis protein RibF [Aerococcaceae bacterium NML190938]|nr:riboflavin biosynthesis protein RibF [Aerococcaceae bacterium NML190938]